MVIQKTAEDGFIYQVHLLRGGTNLLVLQFGVFDLRDTFHPICSESLPIEYFVYLEKDKLLKKLTGYINSRIKEQDLLFNGALVEV